jgi:hypothetical protein
MSFFETNPITRRQVATIGDAVDGLKAFNALYAIKRTTGQPDLVDGDAEATAQWRQLIYEGVINCGGEMMEYDFFEQLFGGKTEYIDAKKLHFRYNDDIDLNICAQDSALATAAGQPVTFTLASGNHSGQGKYSYPVKGYSLYIYEDDQWAQITDKDPSTDFGHRITIKPNKAAYQINIRKGKKMMVNPVRYVGGLSGPQPSSALQSIGYTNHVRPFRIRKDWELAIDLMRGYEDILQWAITFDEAGNEVDAWEPYIKTDGRRSMKWARNLIFFMGQSIDNPDLLGGVDINQIGTDYSGFEGYIPTMKYGGGVLLPFDASVGFDFEADFEPVMIRNDANKQTTEYLIMHPLQFLMGANRRTNTKFKDSGNTTFETFQRMGGDPSAIRKLSIKSYEYMNFSLHMRQIGALSDTRGIGNGFFPQQAYFIPGNGLKDSRGNRLPAMQFFMPQGKGATGLLEEIDVDNRKVEKIDKLSGYLAETLMMAIHCPHLHLMAKPYGFA